MAPRIIAHRGLLTGPSKICENDLSTFDTALYLGFDIELDLNGIDGDNLILNHDVEGTKTSISKTYLFDLMEAHSDQMLFLHCKRNIVLGWCLSTSFPNNVDYFAPHDKDASSLTRLGRIWSYPGLALDNDNYIDVLPEWNHAVDHGLGTSMTNVYAICTDYPLKVRENLSRNV